MTDSMNAKNRIGKFSALPGIEGYIDICVYLTLISNFFILLGNPLRNDMLVSFGTRILIFSIILLAALVIIYSFKRTSVDKVNAWYIAVIFLSGFAVLISATFSILNVIVPYICFIMLPSYAVLYRNARNIKLLKKVIYISNLVYCLIYVYFYFSDKSHIFYGEYGERIIEDLTLGYRNSNEAGMYLLLSFIILFSYIIKTANIPLKVIGIALSAFLAIMIWQTNSRTCFILAILLVAFTIFKWIYKIGNKFINIVFILPALFAILTLSFPEFFEDLMIFGQAASTGRTWIYKSFINNLNVKDFIFGNFLKYPGSNLHNSYVSVLAMFGFPVLLIFIKYLKTIVDSYKANLLDSQNYIAFLGFLAVILHGIAEGTLLISGAVYAGLAGLLFILMLPDNEEKKV